MANLGDMVVRIVGDATGFSKSLNGVQKQMVAFGINAAMVVAAVGKIVKVLSDATKAYMSYGGAIDDASMKTGMTTDAIQEWKYIAEQTGTTLESVTGSVAMMTRGLTTNAEVFAQLGIETKKADGTFRSTTEIFNDTIETLSGMSDETERDQMAFKLLGRSAQSLIPILANGTEAIADLRTEAHDLGIVLDKETISRADALGDATDGLKAALKGASAVMVDDMAPALMRIVNWLKQAIEKSVEARKEYDNYQKAIAGEVLSLDELELALKGASDQLKIFENARDASGGRGYGAGIDKQIAATTALIESLKKQIMYRAMDARGAGVAAAAQATKDKDAAIAAESARIAEEARATQAEINSEADIKASAMLETAEMLRIANVAEYERQMAEETARLKETIAIEAIDTINQKSKDDMDDLAEYKKELMDQEDDYKKKLLDASIYANNQLFSVVDQAYQNEIERIEQSEASEEDKAHKIAELKYKQAKWDRAQALVDVAINTAVAMVAVSKAGIPGLVLAAVIGALGVAQAAVISSQPLPPVPLAEGGIVMPTDGGTLAQIAEAGQPEAVIPLDRFGDLSGDIHLVVNLDSRPFLDKIFPATKNRTILISAGAVV